MTSLASLEPKYIYKESNKNDYDIHALCKSRVVDPLFSEDGKLKRVSDIDKKWSIIIEKESKPKEYYLKFEK